MKRCTFHAAAATQRGAATLIVVMVLFFIVSLVAAYTNRNLIFEQRTSTNQYRSTQALEAAEAGVEWALAMLNHQRITATCSNSAVGTDPSYRQRYVITDPATGNLTPRPKADGTPRSQACVFNGTDWTCSCPEDADPAPAQPAGNDVFPAFRVWLEQIMPPGGPPSSPGVIRIHAVGCTRLDLVTCLALNSQGLSQEGRAEVKVLAALTGNAVSPPSAAVLARNDITLTAAASAFNAEPAGSGITLQAGGAISSPNVVLHSTPGTPGSESIVDNDPALNLAAAVPFSADDRMFATVFNMTSASFQQQPAAWVLACGGTCTAADVRAAIVTHPGRPLWLQGNLDVDSIGDIASAAEPVLLVIEGSLTFSTAGVTIYGLVYTKTADWITAGSGEIRGAAVAEGRISGAGTPTIVRDSDVLLRLRYGSGSFVRVPGSWVDFR